MPNQKGNIAMPTGPGKQGNALVSPCGRSFRSTLPPRILVAIQTGTMQTTYRNRTFLKSPFDVVLYLRLLERLRPRTVIEVGSKSGGSALWFADMLNTLGVAVQVISIDLDPPRDVIDSRITFLRGNASALEAVLTAETLAALPRPWLISEDSAHRFAECLSVLRFFDFHLAVGDYIVIEDGIVGDMPGPRYAKFENGPNRAVAVFLSERSEDHTIDTELCDHFGYNVTYNPNGWLRRTRLSPGNGPDRSGPTAVDASVRLT